MRQDAPRRSICAGYREGDDQATLIITHTLAACGVFAERTEALGRHVEIRKIDSVIAQIGAAYHGGLGLPADIATWPRRTKDSHKILATGQRSSTDFPSSRSIFRQPAALTA